MTVLGLGATAASEEGRRTGIAWLKHLLLPGIFGGSAGLVIEFFHFLQADPRTGLELLKSWGPFSVIGLLVVVVLGGLLSQLLDISREGVGAQRQMAEAMGRIAEKDDRQIEEIRTLQNYTATQMRRMHEHQQTIAEKLETIVQHLKGRGDIDERRADS